MGLRSICLSHREGRRGKKQKRPVIAKRQKSAKKVLYTIFFNSSGPFKGRGLYYWEVIQEYCVEQNETKSIKRNAKCLFKGHLSAS